MNQFREAWAGLELRSQVTLVAGLVAVLLSACGQTGPLYWYGHGTGSYLGCAITGGTFYDPTTATFPE